MTFALAADECWSDSCSGKNALRYKQETLKVFHSEEAPQLSHRFEFQISVRTKLLAERLQSNDWVGGGSQSVHVYF